MPSFLVFVTAALAAAAGCVADVPSEPGAGDTQGGPISDLPLVHPVGKCYEPKKVGPCKGLSSRWYYNFWTGKCEEFKWGGCDANGNNFETKKDCKRACKSHKICKRAYKVGPCKAKILRWFYNKYTKKCEKFFWGGCKSNGNNYKTRHKCEAKCGGGGGGGNRCKLPKDEGHCKGHKLRWYYSHKDGKCKKFFWTGCGGNSNRFRSRSSCRRHCGHHG